MKHYENGLKLLIRPTILKIHHFIWLYVGHMAFENYLNTALAWTHSIIATELPSITLLSWLFLNQ